MSKKKIFVFQPYAEDFSPALNAIKTTAAEVGAYAQRLDEVMEAGSITERIQRDRGRGFNCLRHHYDKV